MLRRPGMAAALAALLPAAALADAPPYRIVDGKVDPRTYNGFRRYNAVCNHCHGLDGAGSSFGRSLIDRPIPLPDFRDAVLTGRATGTFVMKGYAGDANVAPFIDDIYAYLRARADGALGRGRPVAASQD